MGSHQPQSCAGPGAHSPLQLPQTPARQECCILLACGFFQKEKGCWGICLQAAACSRQGRDAAPSRYVAPWALSYLHQGLWGGSKGPLECQGSHRAEAPHGAVLLGKQDVGIVVTNRFELEGTLKLLQVRGETAGPPWGSIFHSGVICKDSFGLSGWEQSWAQGDSPAGSRVEVRTSRRGLRDSGVSSIPSFGVDEKTQLKRGTINPEGPELGNTRSRQGPSSRFAPRGRARAAEAGKRHGNGNGDRMGMGMGRDGMGQEGMGTGWDGDGDGTGMGIPRSPRITNGARHRQHHHLGTCSH